MKLTSDKLENINRAIQEVSCAVGDKWEIVYPGTIEGNTIYGSGTSMKKRTFNIVPPKAFQKHQEELWMKSLSEYMVVVDPRTVLDLIDDLSTVVNAEQKALKELDHWKANHECEVSRARVLKERPDMPLERIAAYNRMVELEDENKSLKQRISSLEDRSLERSMLQMIHASVMDTHKMSSEQLRYWESHFKQPGW